MAQLYEVYLKSICGLREPECYTIKADYTVLRLLKDIFPRADEATVLSGRCIRIIDERMPVGSHVKITDLLSKGHGNSKDTALQLFVPSILYQKLPPMCPFGHCPSDSSSSAHKPVTMVQSKFNILDMDKNPEVKSESNLWLSVDNDNHQPLEWSSEASIRLYVMQVLKDIARESGFMRGLGFQPELSLFKKDKADIWIVTMLGVPIGAVEVKKPRFHSDKHKSPLENVKVLGQLFDHLSHLQAYAGRQYPFGILSTYKKWRIAWLPDADHIAESIKLPNQSQQYLNLCHVPKEFPDWSQKQKKNFVQPRANAEELSTHETIDRKLCVSDIFDFDEEKLPLYLLSVLRKMNSSPTTPMAPLSGLVPERSYICLSPSTSWNWIRIQEKINLTIKSNVVPSFHDASVYLLFDLKGGGDGRVWLGSTLDGNVFVLKFSDDKSMLEKEAEIWEKVWGCDTVKVGVLNGQNVLAMPWVKSCTEDDLQEKAVKEAIRDAVVKLAKFGYKHEDLLLRHIGLYKNESQIGAVLFDLARTSSVTSRGEAIKEMLNDLDLSEMLKDLHL